MPLDSAQRIWKVSPFTKQAAADKDPDNTEDMSSEPRAEIAADLDYRRKKLRCAVREETTKWTDPNDVSTAMQCDVVIALKMTHDPKVD
jgi:hypothetical protein